jgi:hypothetical protein
MSVQESIKLCCIVNTIVYTLVNTYKTETGSTVKTRWGFVNKSKLVFEELTLIRLQL